MYLALVAGLTACASLPEGRFAVDDVEVYGAEHVGDDALLDAMATRRNPRFFGLFEGVLYDYSIFNRAVLERDMARVERRLRALGYYQAHVRAARVHREPDREVRIEIIVEEGPLTTVRVIETPGWPDGMARPELENGLVVGEAFVEERYRTHRETLEAYLRNQGLAWATVTSSSQVDLAKDRARVVMKIDPGPSATLGKTTVVGLDEIPEERVRAELRYEPGDRYAPENLQRTEQALLNTGVFSSVAVNPQPGPRPDGPRAVPVEITVRESELRQVKLGGGVELNALATEVRGRAGWEDRNFLGGARKFTVEAQPGVVLYPLRINNIVAPERPLLMGELETRLEQPGFPERRTTTFFAPRFGVEPVLLQTDPDPQDPVLGYVDIGAALGVERYWFDRKLRLSVQQNVRYDIPFAYLGGIDERLSNILLGYPEVSVTVDLRDDKLDPHAGFFFEVSAQAAVFGSGRDLRFAPDVRGYIPLGEHLTLALQGQLGLLRPFDYGDTIPTIIADNQARRTADEVRDLQLMFFRGFFAGGPGTNRGYAPRSIGPHANTPFINPAAVRPECIGQRDDATCRTATGGHTLWAAAVALRFPIYRPLLGAVFCDTADVAPRPFTFRARPHLSCGGGLRVATPIGPIRADLGYRIPGLQVLRGEGGDEGNPGTIFGAPLGLNIGIGQAF